jgi:membrane protease YdiL (CAAX protease family)
LELSTGARPKVAWFDLGGELPSSRLPHIGHALLLLILTLLLLFLAQLILISIGQGHHVGAGAARLIQPKRQLAAQAAVYLATLGCSAAIFPLLWGRGFLAGINWNGRKALHQVFRLGPTGLALGFAVQALSSLIPMPKSIPMDDFFRTPSDVWLVALFGTLLAPLVEEIAFRGFLLPAFAIGFDWLDEMLRYAGTFVGARLAGSEPPRHVVPFAENASAGLEAETGNLSFRSRTAVIAASVLSSVLFAQLHSDQIAHAWGGLTVLFCVSLVLTTVRVKSRSVACSAVVHASYNLSVFLTIFVATDGFRHLDRLGQ